MFERKGKSQKCLPSKELVTFHHSEVTVSVNSCFVQNDNVNILF